MARKSTRTRFERSFDEIFNEVYQQELPKFKELEKKIAEDIRDKIIQNLDENVYGYTLSPKYAKWKQKKFSGAGILEATGEYKRSIIVSATDTGYVVEIEDRVHPLVPGKGVPKEPIHMRTLGEWLEYGLPERGLPAFPHWRPVLLEFQNIYGTIEERWHEFVAYIIERVQERMAREATITEEI